MSIPLIELAALLAKQEAERAALWSEFMSEVMVKGTESEKASAAERFMGRFKERAAE